MGLFNFKKDKRFFLEEDFYNDFKEEAEKALSVYESMNESGFKENALAVFDFDFVSDKKEKLEKLKTFFETNYSYKFSAIQKSNSNWLINGETPKLPFDEDSLMFWAIDLYTKGFDFDCILSGYGSLTDPKNLEYLDVTQNTSNDYYEKGIECIGKGNFSNAIINFTTAIRIDSNSKQSFSARGYCKEELQVPKMAKDDYDKAIEIDPNFVEALLYRATNLDNSKNYDEALIEYDKVIKLEPENHLAFFNRGNTKFNLNDKLGACNDWTKAKELGSDYGQERLEIECGK